jgi:hypothetical protein
MMSLAMSVLGVFSRRPEKGADTLVWLATSQEVADVSGRYFVDRELQTPSVAAEDDVVARRLWEVSETQTVMGPSSDTGPSRMQPLR